MDIAKKYLKGTALEKNDPDVCSAIRREAERQVRNLEFIASENHASKAVLEAAGTSLDKVVKTTVFLRDMADFPKMNAIYAEYFGENPPARSTIAVAGLPKGGVVEIEALATK